MESWQIYLVASKKLPPGTLQRIYRRSSRLVAYWAADPRYCNETKRNPLDRIRQMLSELETAGYGDYARWAIDYMAEPLDGQFTYKKPAKSDKGTVDGEAADLLVASGSLISTIRCALDDKELDPLERMKIREHARSLIGEVEELLDAAGMEGSCR